VAWVWGAAAAEAGAPEDEELEAEEAGNEEGGTAGMAHKTAKRAVENAGNRTRPRMGLIITPDKDIRQPGGPEL